MSFSFFHLEFWSECPKKSLGYLISNRCSFEQNIKKKKFEDAHISDVVTLLLRVWSNLGGPQVVKDDFWV